MDVIDRLRARSESMRESLKANPATTMFLDSSAMRMTIELLEEAQSEVAHSVH